MRTLKKLTVTAVAGFLALGLCSCGMNYHEQAVERAGFANPTSLGNTRDLVVAEFGNCDITLRFNRGVHIEDPSDEQKFIKIDKVRLTHKVKTDPAWGEYKSCIGEDSAEEIQFDKNPVQ